MNFTAYGFVFKSSFYSRQSAFGSEVDFNFNIWKLWAAKVGEPPVSQKHAGGMGR